MLVKTLILYLAAPILSAIVVFTLKPILKALAPTLDEKIRKRYLKKVDALGSKSNIGCSSVLALFLSIFIFGVIAIKTEWIFDDFTMLAASIIAIAFFYSYFFFYFWITSLPKPSQNDSPL